MSSGEQQSLKVIANEGKITRKFFLDLTGGGLSRDDLRECINSTLHRVSAHPRHKGNRGADHPADLGYWVILEYHDEEEMLKYYTRDKSIIIKIFQVAAREQLENVIRRNWHRERADTLRGVYGEGDNSPLAASVRLQIESHERRAEELTFSFD